MAGSSRIDPLRGVPTDITYTIYYTYGSVGSKTAGKRQEVRPYSTGMARLEWVRLGSNG